jgi:ribonuclease BN (tRNA processing enzyme)
MSFLVLGVGDAFSNRHYSSCLAVHANGAWLLVDCPHPIRKMMREASAAAGLELDVDRVEAVALTHLHADHASGLEGLLFYRHFVLRNRILLAAHQRVAARLWSGQLATSMDMVSLPGAEPAPRRRLEDYAELTRLSERRATRVGHFKIECRRTQHPIPTTAFRIHAGGRSLGYSADTTFDPALVAWLAEADLFVHETNHGIHTDFASLCALPPELRSRMRLIHYPDAFDRESSSIPALRQGQLVEL